MAKEKSDLLDRLVIFLAKRDGIDKLVKTFQYTFKLTHWRLQHTHPELANRANLFSAQCGLSRKAFRTGRFLTGFNTLRTTKQASKLMTLLAIAGHSGDMVYFFFDHFTWMAKAGLLDSHLAARFSHISASGEVVAYLAFITIDIILIRKGQLEEKQLLAKLAHQRQLIESVMSRLRLDKHSKYSPFASLESPRLVSTGQQDPKGGQATVRRRKPDGGEGARQNKDAVLSPDEVTGGTSAYADVSDHIELQPINEEIEELTKALLAIRTQRLMRLLGIAAYLADLIIAIADIEPNPFCNHPVTLGISGLVSAWGGWYRAWPFPT